MVGALYAGPISVLYRIARERVERRLRGTATPGNTNVLAILSVLVLLLPAAGIALLVGSLQYLDFVFASTLGTLIGLFVAGAATLAALGFQRQGDRAVSIGDIAPLVAFFWLGLWFIVLYHVLWVLFMITLGTIWPLRTVVPK
jgi:hypothetical protein